MRKKLKKAQNEALIGFTNQDLKKALKYYVSTKGQDIDPCIESEDYVRNSFISRNLIDLFTENIFKSSEMRYFIILADSGMGKTTFLLKLFFSYYKKISKKYNINFVYLGYENSITLIKKIENKSNTILLLDAFDEDIYAIENYNERLKVICNETELFYKVIMTCRTQFFPDNQHEPKNTGKLKFGTGNKKIEFVKYYISPFCDEEIDKYLKKKFHFFKKNKRKRAKKLVANCPNLMIRPMLLSYIDDLLEDKEKQYKYTHEIYRQLVYKWIDREAIDNDRLYNFSDKVAEYMYINKTVYISQNKIENLCREYNIQLRSIEAKSRSLLNRNAIGEYKFAHKSILEYFLAKKAFEDLTFRKTITLSKFEGYDMVKIFLEEMSCVYLQKLLKDNSFHISNLSFEYLQLSNSNISKTEIVNCDFKKCNLIKANFSYSYLNKINLRGANLKGANLIGTDLKEVHLEGANLKGANLKKLDLRGANLIGTDLRGADLEDANLKGVDIQASVWLNKDIKKILHQLRETKFNYITIENKNEQERVDRTRLFPDEGIRIRDIDIIETYSTSDLIDFHTIKEKI